MGPSSMRLTFESVAKNRRNHHCKFVEIKEKHRMLPSVKMTRFIALNPMEICAFMLIKV